MRTPRPWALPLLPTGLPHLASLGITREMIDTQLAAGRLLRLRRGVYLAADAWPEQPEQQQLLLARAEQVIHPQAVISHGTAALVWGLPSPRLGGWRDEPPTVTLPRSAGHRARQRSVVHRSGSLPPHHVTRDHAGHAVTTVARTAVDLVVGLPLPEALVVLDAAERQLVSAFVANPRRVAFANPQLAKAAGEALREVTVELRRGGLRPALELADPRRETPIESLTAGHLRLAGLPAPEYQAEIRTPRGVFYPDFLWREAGLIGEADGAVKYTDQRAMVLEKEREQVLIDAGFRFVRWLGKEIWLTPEIVMARIARALGM